MRNAVLLAAGLTAIRHASAAYDTTICGKTNKFTSSDTQFICTWIPQCTSRSDSVSFDDIYFHVNDVNLD